MILFGSLSWLEWNGNQVNLYYFAIVIYFNLIAFSYEFIQGFRTRTDTQGTKFSAFGVPPLRGHKLVKNVCFLYQENFEHLTHRPKQHIEVKTPFRSVPKTSFENIFRTCYLQRRLCWKQARWQ